MKLAFLKRSHSVAAILAMVVMSGAPVAAQPEPSLENPLPVIPGVPVTSDATPPAARSAGPATPAELSFHEMDADGNGLVSLPEFAGFMEARTKDRRAAAEERARTGVDPSELLFRQIDRNNDSLLSESEVSAFQDGRKL